MGYEVFESRGLNGQDELVEQVKQKAGELYDLMNSVKTEPVGEAMRCFKVAGTNLEQSIMWFVKGVSRSKPGVGDFDSQGQAYVPCEKN